MEYAIWGIPPGHARETLLIARIDGREIRDRAVAERLVALLADKHGVTGLRIQEIDMGGFNFVKEIGL